MDLIYAILMGVAGATLAAAVLIRIGRVERDVTLDRVSRERIERRVGELDRTPKARAKPGPLGGRPLVSGPGAGGASSTAVRRRLWRDTSAALVVLGAGLMVVLVVTGTPPPAGGVLQATATPRVGLVAAAPSIEAGTTADPSSRPTGPQTRTAAPFPSATSGPGSTRPTASPAPRPTTAPTTAPPRDAGDRLAVLTPCPAQPNCFIYTVRRGDNLVSIANWFGIPYSEVLALNPRIGDPGTVHAGDRITLPRPRR